MIESECQIWFPCGRAICHTLLWLSIVCSKLPPKLSGLKHDFDISPNYVGLKFGPDLIVRVLCFCGIGDIILCIQLVVGLILKVQDGFTHMYSDLRRMTGSTDPAETVDQSAYIWCLQCGGVRAVELLTWQLASPRVRILKDLNGSCKSSYDWHILGILRMTFLCIEIGKYITKTSSDCRREELNSTSQLKK